MALKKSKELASGITGEYLKIDAPSVSGSITECRVFLFKDAAARQSNKPPIEDYRYVWSGEDNPCTIAAMNVAESNPIKLCYDKLKTLDEFVDAEDV